MLISGSLFALFVLISILPFAMGWLSSLYLTIFVPMGLIVLYLASRLMASGTPGEGRKRIRQLYLSNALFIIAFIAIHIAL